MRVLWTALLCVLVVGLGVRTHVRNRVWQSDLALWKNAVEQSPDNGRAHLNYGLAQLARGDRVGARESIRRCQQAWPAFVFCHINQAVIDIDEKRWSEAHNAIATAEALDPNNVYVSLWRGHLERRRESWALAQQAYARTLAIAPGHLDARRGFAFSTFMLGQAEEARAALVALDREQHLDADGAFALGFLFQRASDRTRAKAYYESAIALDPNHASAHYNLGVVLHESGDRVAALAEYSKATSDVRLRNDALFNTAVAAFALGDLTRARAARDELARHAPDYPGLSALAF